MASLESLPADQRAVLQLVLQRGRSYDQIARLLSMDRAAVRQRAVGALIALGPDTGLPEGRRELISDYLLGQLEPEASEAVRDGIGGSPADRAWARVVASELGPLVSTALPEIPNGPVPFAAAGPAAVAPSDPPAALVEPPAAQGATPVLSPTPEPPAPPVPAPAPAVSAPQTQAPSEPAPAGKRKREPLFLGRKRGAATPETTSTPKAPKAPKAPKEKKAREPLFLGRKRGADAPPPAAAAPDLAPGDGDGRRSSRFGGAVLILLTVVIVAAIVVILLNKSGGSSSPAATNTAAAVHSSTTSAPTSASASATTGAAASTTTTASSSGSAKVIAQINLTPPSASSKAAGIAEVLKEGSSDGIAIVAQNVTPNTTKPPNAYAVWLYNSPTDSHILGFVNPGVGANGRLSTAGGLPTNASHYKQLIVTLESKASPKTPGQIILQGTLSGL